MRLIKNIGFALILAIAFNACFTAPTYPVVPQIEVLNDELYFGKSTEGGFDSLVVSLKFKDGDGDLGIDDSFTSNAYKQTFYFTYQNQPVTYKTKRLNPSLKLPDFVTPYNCINWEVQRNVSNVVTDTLYIELNPNYYNIFIDFETKNPDGTFTKFDPASYFKYPNCSPQGYNARFPVLSKDPGKKSPLDGKLIYSIKSVEIADLFSIKTLRLKISIQDRALNKSNPVTTKEFTLAGITKKG